MQLPSRFQPIVDYMSTCMSGSTHDAEHVLRVVHYAADIAAHTDDALDTEILLAAAMLHDIARPLQDKDASIDHANAGAGMAQEFLRSLGWSAARAKHVYDCVDTHRFRSNHPPQSIEAKILFDADKLDVTGAFGIARTLSYGAEHAEPYYTRDASGAIEDGSTNFEAERESFFREYHFKLKRIHTQLFTAHARAIAAQHQATLEQFYAQMCAELHACFAKGEAALQTLF